MMSEQNQDPLVEEALHWLVILRDKTVSDADRQAFERWLKRDADHEAAWRRAQQVWMRLDRIGPAFKNRAQPPPAPTPPPRLVAPPWMRPTVSKAPVPARIGRRRLFLYAAATAAAVIPAAGIVLSRPGLFADHTTLVGERRTISLDDESSIELASASSVSIDFSSDLRRVVLHEGEAYFNVASDPARPFVVDAASGRIWALGTAFDVKIAGAQVTVAVMENSIDVSAEGAGQVAVNEGQQVRYGRRRMGTVLRADLDQVEAWRSDRLIFRDTPLGDVMADLERYRGGRIVLMDARLRTLAVTATFDTSDADDAIDAIASTLPVRVRRVSSLLVVLSSSD